MSAFPRRQPPAEVVPYLQRLNERLNVKAEAAHQAAQTPPRRPEARLPAAEYLLRRQACYFEQNRANFEQQPYKAEPLDLEVSSILKLRLKMKLMVYDEPPQSRLTQFDLSRVDPRRDDMHQHLTNRLNQLIVDEAPDVADAHFLAHSDPLTELGGMLEDVRREREQRDTSSSRRADATIASALRTRAPPDRIHHHSEQTGEQEVTTLDQQIRMILLRGRPTHPTSPSPAG